MSTLEVADGVLRWLLQPQLRDEMPKGHVLRNTCALLTICNKPENNCLLLNSPTDMYSCYSLQFSAGMLPATYTVIKLQLERLCPLLLRLYLRRGGV